MKIHINWYGENEIGRKLQGLFREPVYGNFLDVQHLQAGEVKKILNANFACVQEATNPNYDAWYIIHN